jgi:hypothetical protein
MLTADKKKQLYIFTIIIFKSLNYLFNFFYHEI